MLREIDSELTWLWSKLLTPLMRISHKDNFFWTKALYVLGIGTSLLGIIVINDGTIRFISFTIFIFSINFRMKLAQLEAAIRAGKKPPVAVIFTHPRQYEGRFILAINIVVALSFVPYAQLAWILVASCCINFIAMYWAVDYKSDQATYMVNP